MSKKLLTGEESAFPIQRVVTGTAEDYFETAGQPGLTIFQYYVGLAMQSLIRNKPDIDWTKSENRDELDSLSDNAITIASDIIATINCIEDD